MQPRMGPCFVDGTAKAGIAGFAHVCTGKGCVDAAARGVELPALELEQSLAAAS